METVYIIHNPETTPTIMHKHKNEDIVDKKIYEEYYELKKKVNNYTTNDPFIKKILNLDTVINDSNYKFKLFGVEDVFNYINYTSLTKYDIRYVDKNKDINIINTQKIKTTWFLNGMVSQFLYNEIKDMNYCDREHYLYHYHLKTINLLFDYISIGGNYYHAFIVLCKTQQVQLIYLLSYLFKKITIYDGIFVFCQYFLGEQYIKKSDIINLKSFTVTSVNDEYIKDYIHNVYNNSIHIYKLFLNNEIDEYLSLSTHNIYKKIISSETTTTVKTELYKLIIDNLKRVMIDNNISRINSAIKSQEGNFITEMIQLHHLKSCLEVGCAFGISAMYILSSGEDVTLISIDPFQSTQWNNNGKKLIKQLNMNHRHKIIEDKSYNALPMLLSKHKFDFIFIDGWHTFDYTLIDFFYSFLLLNIGGIIIIDDALHKGVNKCVRYLETNYTNQCKKLKSPPTVACFKKIKEDTRPLNYNVHF